MMNEPRLDRVPPQNIDAERSVLGAMMLPDFNKEAIPKVIDMLEVSDFYKVGHQKIYEAITALFVAGTPSDLLTVAQKLIESGDIKKVGDTAYLDEMIDSVPSSAHVEYYAEMVKEASARRKVMLVAWSLYNDAFDDGKPIFDSLSKTQNDMIHIQNDTDRSGAQKIKDTLKDTFAYITEAHSNPGQIIGMSTGFPELDKALSGLQDSDLIIIAGRPSMGKSAALQNILSHIVMVEKKPAILFSLEMSKHQIGLRMISSESGISLNPLRSGNIRSDDFSTLAETCTKISEAPFFIDDTVALTPAKLRARASRYKAEFDIGLLALDYMQLMTDPVYVNQSEQREVAAISRELKSIARELAIPVLAVSQLNRKVEDRPDPRPKLSDLRSSGAIEQDADVVIFVYRPQYYDESSSDPAEFIIAKQRNGPLGAVKVRFNAPCTRFHALDDYDSGTW